METLLEQYKQSLQSSGIRSIDEYLSSIREYFRYLADENLHPLQLSHCFGDEYRSFLCHKEPALNRRTINNKLNRINRFYRYLVKRGQLTLNPFAETQSLQTGRVLPKNIHSVKDIACLLDQFSLRVPRDYLYRVLIEILYGSALRISEACSLKLSDIDFKSKTLCVYEGKTGNTRLVPATDMSLILIQEYLADYRPLCMRADEIDTDCLFPQRGKTTMRLLLNRKLKSECRRLALPVITSHCLRHTAATHMLKSGAGIRQVQAFLGHEKIQSTQVYTRIVTDDLHGLLTLHHPREAGA